MCSALQNLFDFYNKDWILTEDILEMKKKIHEIKIRPQTSFTIIYTKD